MKKTKDRIAWIGAITLGVALHAAEAAAVDTEGLFVELAVNTNHLAAQDEEEAAASGSVFLGKNAVGGTILLGYGFTPSFAARLAISGAEHDTTDPEIKVSYGGLTLEGSYSFRAGQQVRPYIYGGLGGFSLQSTQDEYDYESTGPGIGFGGGVHSFLGEHFVLDAGLRFDYVNWEKQTATRKLSDGSLQVVETPVNESGGASKIVLGAGWWF